jgi:hypothetical protein
LRLKGRWERLERPEREGDLGADRRPWRTGELRDDDEGWRGSRRHATLTGSGREDVERLGVARSKGG